MKRPPTAKRDTGGKPPWWSRRGADRANQGPTHGAAPAAAAGNVLVYGFHAVRAALVAGRRRIVAVHATEAAAAKLAPEIAGVGLQPTIVDGAELARRLGPEAVHQGVLVEAEPIPMVDLSDIVAGSGIILVLDQITDPHNVGAILRTAAAFAVDALVTTTRHAPERTGVLAKAASGGLDHVPVVEATNLARALNELGELGYLRIGLDSDGADSLEAIPLHAPVALVLGAEGKGLRRLTREHCDALARLDMPGAVRSLNVSNACAVALTLTRLRLGGRLPPERPDAHSA